MRFQVTHFKHLDGHKKPVLHLLRTILRHSHNVLLPQEQLIELHQLTLSKFKQYRGLMSGHYARQCLLAAMEYEKKLRDIIENSSEVGADIHATLKQELAKEYVPGKKAAPNHNNESHQLIEDPLPAQARNATMRDRTKSDHTQNDLPETVCTLESKARNAHAEGYKDAQRKKSYEEKVARKLRMAGTLSEKVPLDPIYFKSFIIPQHLSRDNRLPPWWINQNPHLMIYDEEPRKVFLKSISTPLGQMAYLKIPTRKRQTDRFNAYVSNSLHSRIFDTIEALNSNEELCLMEARWESLVNNETSPDKAIREWTASVNLARRLLYKKRQAQNEKFQEHKKVLESRMRLMSREKVKRFKGLAYDPWSDTMKIMGVK